MEIGKSIISCMNEWLNESAVPSLNIKNSYRLLQRVRVPVMSPSLMCHMSTTYCVLPDVVNEWYVVSNIPITFLSFFPHTWRHWYKSPFLCQTNNWYGCAFFFFFNVSWSSDSTYCLVYLISIGPICDHRRLSSKWLRYSRVPCGSFTETRSVDIFLL